MATSLETRSLLDELRSFDKGGFFDLGHPLLNRIAESFVKAAGIGAIKGVAREGCYLALEGKHKFNSNLVAGTKSRSSSTDISAKNNKKNPFPYLRGETNRKSLEAMKGHTSYMSISKHDEPFFMCMCLDHCISMSKYLCTQVKSTGKESLQWGLAAGLYSGITYGLQEARGAHDWLTSTPLLVADIVCMQKNSAVAGALTGMTVALTCEKPCQEHVLQCAITGAALSTAANLLTGVF
ncbi:hypothetical protein GOBAR_AA35975 [Gossypium barbadense]|uniref:Uncharacterized protein n=1 Tax=Gossypium barbadense TaxID=3634 RepID=A0A2P5W102_GOSBA|nr:hypothetical protein GOBAR_DD31985 [Gossypium barbadense]PPR84737.1 hypothetical protein GOBAR_AA35975 [Gossypium barbadense]